MKIRDFSEEKGLTKQAIYKAISRAGFSAKQITDRNGNITSKGFSILRTLFPDAEQKEQESSQEEQAKADKQSDEVERLKLRIEELEQKCEQWQQRYFDAIDSAKKESEQFRALLLQEQQLRMSVEKQGFFKRLFAGKKAEQDDK